MIQSVGKSLTPNASNVSVECRLDGPYRTRLLSLFLKLVDGRHSSQDSTLTLQTKKHKLVALEVLSDICTEKNIHQSPRQPFELSDPCRPKGFTCEQPFVMHTACFQCDWMKSTLRSVNDCKSHNCWQSSHPQVDKAIRICSPRLSPALLLFLSLCSSSFTMKWRPSLHCGSVTNTFTSCIESQIMDDCWNNKSLLFGSWITKPLALTSWHLTLCQIRTLHESN